MLGQHVDEDSGELYVGNLTAGAVSGVMLRDHEDEGRKKKALGGDDEADEAPIVRKPRSGIGACSPSSNLGTSRRRRWLWRSSTATTRGRPLREAGPRATRTWGRARGPDGRVARRAFLSASTAGSGSGAAAQPPI